jgi:hypothetical protein
VNAGGERASLAARLSVAALGLLGVGGGWWIVLSGGFVHVPGRDARDATFVDGAPALAMAAIFFVLGALGAAVLAGTRWRLPAAAVVLVPPVLFLLLR